MGHCKLSLADLPPVQRCSPPQPHRGIVTAPRAPWGSNCNSVSGSLHHSGHTFAKHSFRKSEKELVTQSRPSLCSRLGLYSPPASSVREILQARTLEWVARVHAKSMAFLPILQWPLSRADIELSTQEFHPGTTPGPDDREVFVREDLPKHHGIPRKHVSSPKEARVHSTEGAGREC